MLNVEWRSVVNFEGYYEVSSGGDVRSCDRMVKCSVGNNYRLWKGKLLTKIVAATRGYHQVSLSKNGRTFKVYVHRLVAEAFITPYNETVNHKDGNKLNNNLSNLEWVSYSENNRHAFRTGLKTNKRRVNDNHS